jgi:2-polyprenyl-6-methoxyphenol hydroxylase-like FAD-dependent oxidoreductase
VIFVGDAAHSMTPHLGQGANLALIDGKTLCDEILSRDDIVTAGAAYARRRRGQVAYYARLSGLLNPFFQSDVPGLAIARDLVLPWLPSVPLVGVEMRRTVAGYKRGWFGGSIDLNQTDLG